MRNVASKRRVSENQPEEEARDGKEEAERRRKCGSLPAIYLAERESLRSTDGLAEREAAAAADKESKTEDNKGGGGEGEEDGEEREDDMEGYMEEVSVLGFDLHHNDLCLII